MTIQLGGVTIDCLEPRKLAEFWTQALDAEIDQDFEGFFITIVRKGDDGRYVGLQQVPEERAGKNRVHLDFSTEDRPAEVARLVNLGAKEVAEHTVPGLTWTVLRDPEGNEFCVGSTNG